jgi:hypothetical protein
MGAFLLLGGAVYLLTNEETARRMHGFWTRPRATGRFAWTDVRLFQPSLKTTRLTFLAVGLSMAGTGLGLIIASLLWLEATPFDLSGMNIPGLLSGITIFVLTAYLMTKKDTLAQKLQEYVSKRSVSGQPVVRLDAEAAKTIVEFTGLAAIGGALILIVLSL